MRNQDFKFVPETSNWMDVLGLVVSLMLICVFLTGCAQTSYLKPHQVREAKQDAAECQAELTRMIWAGEKPLLTGRWFNGCMREHGWEKVTLARVAP